MKITTFTLIAALCFGGVTAHSQISRTITYQGVLKDASGARVTATVALDLNIYATTGGGSLYSDSHAGVDVANGLFSVVIGTGTGGAISLPFDQPYELGVTVDSGTELSPRTILTAAPYALNASGVNISGGSAGDVLTNDGNGNGAWGAAGAGPQGPQGKAGADGTAGTAGTAGAQGDPGPVGSEFWDGDIAGDIYSVNSGNVGVGTTSPATTFEVAGLTNSKAVRLSANGGGDNVPLEFLIKANNNASSVARIFGAAGSTPSDNSLLFSSNSTDVHMELPGGGGLKLNKLTSSKGLTLKGNGGGDSVPLDFVIKADNNATSTARIFGGASSTESDNFLGFSGNSVDVHMELPGDGGLKLNKLTNSRVLSLAANSGGDNVPLDFVIKANNNSTSTAAVFGAAGSTDADNFLSLSGGGGHNHHLSIMSSGNVGIGHTAPDGKLHVAGMIRADSHMVIPDDYEFMWSGTGTSIGGRPHKIYFQVGSGIPMQIMSDKRVLIGAADGGAATDVNPIRLQVHGRGMLGALGIGKGDGDALNAKLDVAGDAFIGEASDGIKLDVLGHNGVVFRVNGYDNATSVFGRADGLGTAAIGTQNLNLAGISYRLMVHSSHVKRTLGLSADANVETGIHLLDGGTERWRIYSDNDVASGEAGHKKLIFAKGDGTDLFSFTQGGDLTLRNLTQTSDERLKENIQTVSAALDKVMQLRGVSFDWRDGPDSGLGVVAQEVEAVVPEMVHTGDDGYKSVRYSQISALLIEAMKEQQAHIEALEAEVETLKANN
jgi:hypothetical protein